MHAAEVPFVSLADLLRSRPSLEPSAPEETPVQSPLQPAVPACTPAVTVSAEPAGWSRNEAGDEATAIREARLFRAALGDAFDALLANLAGELAVNVLGRELRLAAVDIEVLARRLIGQYYAQEPLRLYVAAADADVACELPVAVDPALQPGDAILECRSGGIDARLHVRLAKVVAMVEW